MSLLEPNSGWFGSTLRIADAAGYPTPPKFPAGIRLLRLTAVVRRSVATTSNVTVQLTPVEAFGATDGSAPPDSCTLPAPGAAVSVPPQVVDALGTGATVIVPNVFEGNGSVRVIGDNDE